MGWNALYNEEQRVVQFAAFTANGRPANKSELKKKGEGGTAGQRPESTANVTLDCAHAAARATERTHRLAQERHAHYRRVSVARRAHWSANMKYK